MADYERIMIQELGLHHAKNPNALLKPGQVQMRRSGAMFGRFKLDDVFEGDFSDLGLRPEARMANIERSSSDKYDLGATAKLTGPLGLLKSAQGSLEACGAKQVQITALDATLAEVDEGDLMRRLRGTKARRDGPLGSDDVAIVLVAVASVKDFSIRLDDGLGAKIEVGTEIANSVAAEASVDAEVSRARGLTISTKDPLPFAARVWRVERALLGRNLAIGTLRGPANLLGPKEGLDPEFVTKVGLVDGALDL